MVRIIISCILLQFVLTVLAQSSQNSTSLLQTMTTTVTANMPPPTTTESSSSALTAIHSASTTTAQLSTMIQPTNTITGGLQTTVAPTSAAEIKYNANMTLTGKQWSSDYLAANSSESRNLLSEIETEIKKFFDSCGVTFKNFTDINFKNYSGKVQAVLTMVVSPAGGSTEHKDPLLLWKEAVDKEKIGSLAVDKESTKLREEISPGTTVGEWKTKDGECDKCNVGPVAQERTCSGGGCSNVLTTRWVTCSEGSCIPSTGPILLSSLPLVIAALMLVFFA